MRMLLKTRTVLTSVSPIHIANNILKLSFDDKTPINAMKLQRILYLVAEEYKTQTGATLYNEQFRAWEYGPVLRSVYDQFQSFNGEPLTAYTKNAIRKSYRIPEKRYPALKQALTKVWSETKNKTGVELSRQTRGAGTAWESAVRSGSEYIVV